MNVTNITGNICLKGNRTEFVFCPGPNFIFFHFFVNVVIVGIIILFGMAGNVVSIIILKNDWKRSSMNVLLCTLSIYDFLFLILSVYHVFISRGLALYYPEMMIWFQVHGLERFLAPLTWFLGNITRYGRTWSAIAIAIDRYIMIQNPFLSHCKNTANRAKIVSLVIFLSTVMYNIPRLWEIVEGWSPYLCKMVMKRNVNISYFHNIGYKIILFSIVMVIGPIILLIIFNTILILNLINAQNVRQNLMEKNPQPKTVNKMETKMLVVVIGVFIILELPSCIVQNILLAKEPMHCIIYRIILPITECLVVLNSSTNFLIYYFCGQRFRDSFCKIFCGKSCNSSVQKGTRHIHTSTTNFSIKTLNNINEEIDSAMKTNSNFRKQIQN